MEEEEEAEEVAVAVLLVPPPGKVSWISPHRAWGGKARGTHGMSQGGYTYGVRAAVAYPGHAALRLRYVRYAAGGDAQPVRAVRRPRGCACQQSAALVPNGSRA